MAACHGVRRAKRAFFWIFGGIITPHVEGMSAVYAVSLEMLLHINAKGKSNESSSIVKSEMSKLSPITA